MTIEYKDSKRITALSTDFTTPIVWQNMTDGQSASGNVLSKSGANWTADATSTATFSSSVGAKVEFTVSANTSDSFCGFDISANTDSYNMDYALYCGGGGTINIYANGSQVNATGVSYSTADTLAVNMDSSGTVTFLKNGSVFYTSSTTASGTYRVNAVIYTSGVSLTANYITSKPTDVQDNSLLVEKDTARRYWFSQELAPTYTGDMDSSGWNDSNKGSTISLDTTNNEVDFLNTTGNNSVAFDTSSIETLSTSSWVVRFKLRLSGTQSGDWGVFWYVMSSVRDLTANSTITDCAGFSTQRDPSSSNINPNLSMGNDDKLTSTEVQSRLQLSGSNIQITKDTDYYVEIKRDGSNFTDTVYSDSTFSTVVGTKTNAITGSGLRYLVFANYNQGSGSTATVSDLLWYNETTSVAPATWTLQLSLENLKAYWKMGESSGNLINHATSIGSKTAMSADLVSSGTVNRGQTGHVSGVDSIGFPTYDADGNKVTANNSASDYGFMNKAAAKFTACWWAKNESYNNTVDLWGFGGNGNGTDIQFRNMASGFTIWFSGTEYTSFTQNVGDNNWHFYMLSWDEDGGSNNTQFQLDGTKQTATITTSNTSDATSPLTIGDVSGNEPEMDIQEFSLWNRILSDTEIAHIYNAGVGRQL